MTKELCLHLTFSYAAFRVFRIGRVIVDLGLAQLSALLKIPDCPPLIMLCTNSPVPNPVFLAIWVIPLALENHRAPRLFFQNEPPGAEPFIGMGIGRTPYTLGADPGINGPGKTAVFNQTG